MKQPTILVTEDDERKKRDYAISGLCYIFDWKMGWFDVPLSMKKAFEERFHVALSQSIESVPCPFDITEADIDRINRNNWPEAFWNMNIFKDTTQKYIAEVKGSSYDNFFIKLKDTSEKIVGGASSWRQFEDLTQELREKAKKDGYNDVEFTMSFVM